MTDTPTPGTIWTTPTTDRVIYKYVVEGDTCVVKMPAGGRVLAADMNRAVAERHPLAPDSQPVRMELWAEVDLQHVGDDVEREFAIVGTGMPLPDAPTTHIATVRDGVFVWHLLEVHRG